MAPRKQLKVEEEYNDEYNEDFEEYEDEEIEQDDEQSEEQSEEQSDKVEECKKSETPVTKRKNRARPINKKLQDYGFESEIVERANEIYMIITELKGYRKDNLKKLILYCVYNAGIEIHGTIYMMPIDIARKIKLNKNLIPNAFTLFSPSKTNYKPKAIDITVESAVKMICEKHFDFTNDAIKQIQEIATASLERSKVLRLVNPQKLALGIIYHYMYINDEEIDDKQFTQILDISIDTLRGINKNIRKHI